MKKDKGACLSSDGMRNRTKFHNAKDAIERYNFLTSIEIKSKYNTPYKCKDCGDWHLGTPEEAVEFKK